MAGMGMREVPNMVVVLVQVSVLASKGRRSSLMFVLRGESALAFYLCPYDNRADFPARLLGGIRPSGKIR
jgi:hypothetical protein